jgi:hypothetical protein
VAFRLIGDCRDQGDDPSAWQETAMAGLNRLAGASATGGGEARWLIPDRLLQPVSNHVVGLDAAGLAHQAVYMREYGVNADRKAGGAADGRREASASHSSFTGVTSQSMPSASAEHPAVA